MQFTTKPSTFALVLLVIMGCGHDVKGPDDSWPLDEVDMSNARDMVLQDVISTDMQVWDSQPDESQDLMVVKIQDEECMVPGQLGRCARGRWLFDEVQDELVCTQIYRQMPEVCNNEDSDCDGQVDYAEYDNDVPVVEQYEARFQDFQMMLDALERQGIPNTNFDELLEYGVCSSFEPCIVNSNPPRPLPLKPYENILVEYDDFFEEASSTDITCE